MASNFLKEGQREPLFRPLTAGEQSGLAGIFDPKQNTGSFSRYGSGASSGRVPRHGGRLLRQFLRRIPLFADLEDGQLQRLEGMIREESSPAKRVIFREGDLVDAFYIVKEGLVTVYREEKGKPLQVLARLEEGGYF